MGTQDKLSDCAIRVEHELKKMLATIQRMLVAASGNTNLLQAKNEIDKELPIIHQSIFDNKKKTLEATVSKSPKIG